MPPNISCPDRSPVFTVTTLGRTTSISECRSSASRLSSSAGRTSVTCRRGASRKTAPKIRAATKAPTTPPITAVRHTRSGRCALLSGAGTAAGSLPKAVPPPNGGPSNTGGTAPGRSASPSRGTGPAGMKCGNAGGVLGVGSVRPDDDASEDGSSPGPGLAESTSMNTPACWLSARFTNRHTFRASVPSLRPRDLSARTFGNKSYG